VAFVGNDPSADGLDTHVNYAPLAETIGTSKAAWRILTIAIPHQ
jgi:hypothetical protein